MSPVTPSAQVTDVVQNRVNAMLSRQVTELAQRHNEVLSSLTSLTSATSGRYLGRQVLTASSGQYVPTPGTTTARLLVCGAGGGGGGTAAVGISLSVGGGGGSGVCLEVVLTGHALGPGPYSIGAAGVGGNVTPGAGGTGGDTTITIAGTTYLAKGGVGGGAGGQSGQVGWAAGGNPQAGSTPATVPQTGFVGMNGLIYSTSAGGLGFPGIGAGSVLGCPAPRASINVVPSAPAGFGAGGTSGTADNTSITGGPGGPGAIIVDEWT
jgi:hypothetical protein